MTTKNCRQLRTFPVFDWEEYPGKGLVADVFVQEDEDNIQIGDCVILDDELYTVKELILYYGSQSNSMVGLVTDELFETVEVSTDTLELDL